MVFPIAWWLGASALFGFVWSQDEQWLRSAILDRERRFFVEWGPTVDNDIIFTVVVRTLGYVALGFSRDGTMVNSDMVIGWVSNGQVFLQDRYSQRNEMPNLDAVQDWELLEGGENGTHTYFRLRRKWNTCDPQDYALEYDNTIRLMHAYSFEDPPNPSNILYHGPTTRGWTSFLLLQPDQPREPLVEFWDITTPPITVSPEWDTFYWCGIVKGPQLREKHHITAVDPRITGGNRGNFVHHILIFECVGATAQEFDPFLNDGGYNCFSPDAPRVMSRCDGFAGGWGKGATGLVLPPHIGIPLKTTPKYYMLQVHYDNFNRETGTPGTAGVRFHHTPRLRANDAGYLFVGTDYSTPSNIIPPGVKDFTVAGHGNPDCYGPAVPQTGIRLNSVLLHTHLLGSRLRARHFRGNIELPVLADNKDYDPEYQQYHQFEKEVLMQPFDQLTFECTYDSTSRTRTTFGGFSLREEMCLAFFIYYPRFEGRYGSLSHIPKSTATRIIASQELTALTAGQPDYDSIFVEYMTTYDWNRTAIRRFEDEMRFSEQETLCFLGNGDLTSVRTTTSYPEIVREFARLPTCSIDGSSSIITGRQIRQNLPNQQNIRNQQNFGNQQNSQNQPNLRAQQTLQGQQRLRAQNMVNQQNSLMQKNAQNQQQSLRAQNQQKLRTVNLQNQQNLMTQQNAQNQQNWRKQHNVLRPQSMQSLQNLMVQQNAQNLPNLRTPQNIQRPQNLQNLQVLRAQNIQNQQIMLAQQNAPSQLDPAAAQSAQNLLSTLQAASRPQITQGQQNAPTPGNSPNLQNIGIMQLLQELMSLRAQNMRNQQNLLNQRNAQNQQNLGATQNVQNLSNLSLQSTQAQQNQLLQSILSQQAVIRPQIMPGQQNQQNQQTLQNQQTALMPQGTQSQQNQLLQNILIQQAAIRPQIMQGQQNQQNLPTQQSAISQLRLQNSQNQQISSGQRANQQNTLNQRLPATGYRSSMLRQPNYLRQQSLLRQQNMLSQNNVFRLQNMQKSKVTVAHKHKQEDETVDSNIFPSTTLKFRKPHSVEITVGKKQSNVIQNGIKAMFSEFGF